MQIKRKLHLYAVIKRHGPTGKIRKHGRIDGRKSACGIYGKLGRGRDAVDGIPAAQNKAVPDRRKRIQKRVAPAVRNLIIFCAALRKKPSRPRRVRREYKKFCPAWRMPFNLGIKRRRIRKALPRGKRAHIGERSLLLGGESAGIRLRLGKARHDKTFAGEGKSIFRFIMDKHFGGNEQQQVRALQNQSFHERKHGAAKPRMAAQIGFLRHDALHPHNMPAIARQQISDGDKRFICHNIVVSGRSFAKSPVLCKKSRLAYGLPNDPHIGFRDGGGMAVVKKKTRRHRAPLAVRITGTVRIRH